MQPDRIPLFPLNVVLLPGEQLPLHIFEPRYRRMVHECLESHSPFGMLLALEDGIVKVGCTSEILLVTKRYDDGRMDILCAGRRPFRVLELFQDHPLLEGSVDYLEDIDSQIDARTQEELGSLYETCYTLVFAGLPRQLAPTDGDSLSFAVAATLPIDLSWKQRILELRSEEQRQERLVRYLRDWAPHLQEIAASQQRSAGNGHGLN
jgi:Lon protease-like protein